MNGRSYRDGSATEASQRDFGEDHVADGANGHLPEESPDLSSYQVGALAAVPARSGCLKLLFQCIGLLNNQQDFFDFLVRLVG